MEIILKVLLFFSICTTIYLISSRYVKTYRIINIMCDVKEQYIDKFVSKIEKNIQKKESKSQVITRIQYLINASGIKGSIPFFNMKILLSITLISTIVFFIITKNIIKTNVFVQVEGAILGMLIPFLILQFMQVKTEDKIDEDIQSLIDEGISYSKTENNLIYILKGIEKYINGPVKPVISKLVKEIDRGIIMKEAFRNAEEAVDNIRLKEIFRNLYITSQEDADYRGVFEKSAAIYRSYYKLKEKGKVKTTNAQREVIILILVCILVVALTLKMLPEARMIIKSTLIGKLIVAYFVGVFIFAINRCITIRKFNY